MNIKSSKNVLIGHTCHDSSYYHFNKYKHWIKKITKIDDSKKNGYAFEGEFLRFSNKNLVEVGSYIVEVCKTELSLFKVVDNSKIENKQFICIGYVGRYSEFIRECKKYTHL